MSPFDGSRSESHTVTVIVQDNIGSVQRDVPVSVFHGTYVSSGAVPIASGYTGREGSIALQFDIQMPEDKFVFQIGSDATGIKQFQTVILPKDTTLIFTLDISTMQCNVDQSDTLSLMNICAPLKDGTSFADSVQRTFYSGCTVPLTITYQPVHDPFILDVHVLNSDGHEITDNPFTIPPKGLFIIKAVSHPVAPGSIIRKTEFVGTGPEDASAKLSIVIKTSTVGCDNVNCVDTMVQVKFKATLAQSMAQSSIERVEFAQNRTPKRRIDRVTRYLSAGSPFSLLDSLRYVLQPGMLQSVRVRFAPQERIQYKDTLIVESTLEGSSSSCTSTIVFSGNGCMPECTMSTSKLQPTGDPDAYTMALTVHPNDVTHEGAVYFVNSGQCGTVTLTIDTTSTSIASGFSLISSLRQYIEADRGAYAQFAFAAWDNIIWPEGHGRPARVNHSQLMKIAGCGNDKRIQLNITVDTLPISYSRCFYDWNKNDHYGFSFEPYSSKGQDILDPSPTTSMTSDIVLNKINSATEAEIRLRGDWKLIRQDVQESDFSFARVRLWPEYHTITNGSFSQAGNMTLALRSVYVIKVPYGGLYRFALIRLREASTDNDGKGKICIDVLYPMIAE
jgi:hypothetical protein